MASMATSPVPWITRVPFGGMVVVVVGGTVVVVGGGNVVVVVVDVEVVVAIAATPVVGGGSSVASDHQEKARPPSRVPPTNATMSLMARDRTAIRGYIRAGPIPCRPTSQPAKGSGSGTAWFALLAGW